MTKCRSCGQDVAPDAKFCPQCGAQFGSAPTKTGDGIAGKIAIGCGAFLVIGVVVLLVVCLGAVSKTTTPSYTPPGTASQTPGSSAGIESEPKLERLAFSWHEESDFAICDGQVKNISSEPLSDVEAVVTFKDNKGGFITSEDAFVKYNPILPGQISPYEVMATWNPAMHSASVEFKTLMGGTIKTR